MKLCEYCSAKKNRFAFEIQNFAPNNIFNHEGGLEKPRFLPEFAKSQSEGICVTDIIVPIIVEKVAC